MRTMPLAKEKKNIAFISIQVKIRLLYLTVNHNWILALLLILLSKYTIEALRLGSGKAPAAERP